MNAPIPSIPTLASSGANMDRKIARKPLQRWFKPAGLSLLLVTVAVLGWQAIPRGTLVKLADINVATVSHGVFRDELLLRANVAPLASVMLDATEGGRVETVYVRDGAQVKRGELLFKLSNPQREMEVLARASDLAQQTANLANLKVALATSQSNRERDLATLEFALQQARKSHHHQQQLAAQGFVSKVALEQSADQLAQQQRLMDEARAAKQVEVHTQQQAVNQMGQAIGGLAQGLQLVRRAADGLSVRAASDGRLTDFRLQEGESVKPGDRLGRIDSPDHFKLQANVDEFYLNRLALGLPATVSLNQRDYPLRLARMNPQIKEGRFSIELSFSGDTPRGLQPGQSLDSRIRLGQGGQALLLADGGFYSDSGGSWVFVQSPDRQYFDRRSVRLGRRAAGQIEVLAGLRAGEQVITSSYRAFAQAQQLRIEK